MTTKNARFWTWENDGWVKLTLRPGQSLTYVAGGTHDEGWSRDYTEWRHDGNVVVCEYESDGADCDGRFQHGGVLECSLDSLATVPAYEGGTFAGVVITRPDWQKAGFDWQRDHTAEAAGY